MSFSKYYLDDTFEYLRQIHKSAKSEVVLAINKNNNRLYAIKYIKNTNLPYKEIKDIHHPLLPQIEYVCEEDEQTIVVEEYIDGINLSDLLLEKGALSEEEIFHFVLKICDGLKILHARNIIHRDIKPSNFLIANDGKIKLIDFDASRIAKEKKKHDTKYLGTQGYAPPEQYGFSQTDCRSDIYALGITIKELVGNNYQGKLLKIIDKCARVNPIQRYQSIEELERSLKNIQKPSYIKYAVPFGCLIALILGGGYFYLHQSQLNLTKNVSSVQPNVSNINPVEQLDSRDTTSQPKQKKQIEVKEQEKLPPDKKEPVREEKSGSKPINSETSMQNTPAVTMPQTEIESEIAERKRQERIEKQGRKVSADEVDAYFQLSGFNKLKLNDSTYSEEYIRNPNKISAKTTGALAEDFPGSRYITEFEYLNIEVTNLSDEDIPNAWVSIRVVDDYMALLLIKQKPAKGEVLYGYKRTSKDLIYKQKLHSYKLYDEVQWTIGRLHAKEHASFSLPLAGSVLFKENTVGFFIAVVSGNNATSAIVHTNYLIYFKS